MKTMLMAGAALAMIAGTATAQSGSGDWASQTYGQDAIGIWNLNASVNTFCRLNAGGGRSESMTNASFAGGGSAGTDAEADGVFTLNIQGPVNTVQFATGAVVYDNSQCNRRFRVFANSQNGGLRNTGNTTGDNDFLPIVPYDIGLTFGGPQVIVPNVVAGNNSIIATQEATADDFRLAVRVNEDRTNLLLQGAYTDRLVFTMEPIT